MAKKFTFIQHWILTFTLVSSFFTPLCTIIGWLNIESRWLDKKQNMFCTILHHWSRPRFHVLGCENDWAQIKLCFTNPSSEKYKQICIRVKSVKLLMGVKPELRVLSVWRKNQFWLLLTCFNIFWDLEFTKICAHCTQKSKYVYLASILGMGRHLPCQAPWFPLWGQISTLWWSLTSITGQFSSPCSA